MSDEEEEERGPRPKLSFSVPAITLPPIRLPEHVFHFLPPKMRRRERETGLLSHLLLAVLVDVVDLALVFAAGTLASDLVRTATGTLLVALFAGSSGLLYAWEVVAVLAGVAHLTAVPSATLLVSVRALRQ